MCHFSLTRACHDLFWLCFPIFMLAEGNDRKSSLTNNMQALYIMDQSWSVSEGGIYGQSDAIKHTYYIRT